MTDKERADLKDAEAVCRRFLAWDLDVNQEENVKERLKSCLGINIDEDEIVTEH
jgi:DNA mismatch repair protein MSH5